MRRKRKNSYIIFLIFLLILIIAVVLAVYGIFERKGNDIGAGVQKNHEGGVGIKELRDLDGTVFDSKSKTDELFFNKSDLTDNISDTEDRMLILVNRFNYLPDNFMVELSEVGSGHFVDERIYDDLTEMLDAAKGQGLSPIICSSYRTNEKQMMLYASQVQGYIEQGYSEKNAEEEAAKWVALPGTSEHETGLAVDIVSLDYQILDKKQEETAEQEWLANNSYKYGFILRYPNDKSEITGINYEPWHYRYVGKTAAEEIFEENLCLEEYLEIKTQNTEKPKT